PSVVGSPLVPPECTASGEAHLDWSEGVRRPGGDRPSDHEAPCHAGISSHGPKRIDEATATGEHTHVVPDSRGTAGSVAILHGDLAADADNPVVAGGDRVQEHSGNQV